MLTPPPQNETSFFHLRLSRLSKFSSNIKLPEQILVGAADPLAVVIDGLQSTSSASEIAGILDRMKSISNIFSAECSHHTAQI